MIYQISHIALKIKHYSSNLFDNSIDWKQFMSQIFECWSALIADTNFGSLVQISDFVHVVIGTRIIKTSCPRHYWAVGLSRNKSPCIWGNLLLNRPIKVEIGLDLGWLLLRNLLLLIQSRPWQGISSSCWIWSSASWLKLLWSLVIIISLRACYGRLWSGSSNSTKVISSTHVVWVLLLNVQAFILVCSSLGHLILVTELLIWLRELNLRHWFSWLFSYVGLLNGCTQVVGISPNTANTIIVLGVKQLTWLAFNVYQLGIVEVSLNLIDWSECLNAGFVYIFWLYLIRRQLCWWECWLRSFGRAGQSI
jgi:hypothetical protein